MVLKKLSLKAILQTHHHEDHIGGTQELIKDGRCKGNCIKKEIKRIPFQSFSVSDNDNFDLLDGNQSY